MINKTPITVAYGDGIGPEIMQATLDILMAANAQIETDVIEVGKKIYLQGYSSGISQAAWDSLRKTKVLLKGPITTPQGGGYKSLNVTMRKTMGLFANVRPCISYSPYIKTFYPNIDLVIIRENEEDTYSGIEYRGTEEVYECLKLISRPGCEHVILYAFEYARRFNRKKVTCFSKDNIMKMTDGLFHSIFDEIAVKYPDIEHDHFIIDIGTALLATHPEQFDVIVTLNLYGDIISDVAAQLTGSVGLAGSANIGRHMAMFEAIHGSAPTIAGQNIANPSGLLNAAVQMLIHINQPDTASLVENAWLKTLEDGIHTVDIYSAEHSKQKVGTKEFAQAVIARLGQTPQHFKKANYQTKHFAPIEYTLPVANSKKELVGVDIYIDNARGTDPIQLAAMLSPFSKELQLINITSKGLKVWPNGNIEVPYIRHCSCRFLTAADTNNLKATTHKEIIQLLQKFLEFDFDVIKTDNLYTFDGHPGFSLAQGE